MNGCELCVCVYMHFGYGTVIVMVFQSTYVQFVHVLTKWWDLIGYV